MRKMNIESNQDKCFLYTNCWAQKRKSFEEVEYINLLVSPRPGINRENQNRVVFFCGGIISSLALAVLLIFCLHISF